MKHILLPLALLAPVPAFAQTTASPPVVKGTALPPPATEEAAVLATLDAVFAAFAAGNGAALLAHVYPQGLATSVEDGHVQQFTFGKFAGGLTPERAFVERIWSPAVEIDGDIAMVWAPYDVRVKDKVSNCGIDHFDLIREQGKWKVMNVTFSSRTTGCEGQ